MINKIRKNRYLILRRIVQFVILTLFFGSNWFGWHILTGNYSSAKLFDSITLTDPFAVLQMLATGFVASITLITGSLTVLGIYLLLFGRSFCAWVCPMNIVTDFTSVIRRKLQINNQVLEVSRKTRYYIAALALILSAIMGVGAFEIVSPIGMLHRGVIYGFGIGWAAVLLVVLFDLVILKQGWCGHICPLGAVYSLTGYYNLVKVKHNKNACTKCMKCIVHCPEKQVLSIIGKQSGFIKSGECTNCGKCIEVCDDDALHLSLNNYKKPI